MRLTAEHRRAQIVKTAHDLSLEGGLYDWTLDEVATHCGVSQPAVRYYFYSATGLRAEIITAAIAGRDLEILVQALAKCDPIVDDLSTELRAACAEWMVTP